MDFPEYTGRELAEHIKAITGTSVNDTGALLRFFKHSRISKKQIIQQADRECTTLFFVVRGCLRMYFVDSKGVERTTQFALENWWLTDFLAFERKQRTEFAIQAVEPAEVLSIDHNAYQSLLAAFSQMERYFRIIYQYGYGAALLRMKYQQDFSREELYRHFARQFPDFVQRVPQYLLASYLDITPEYLSELRKKRS
ncbi:cyclic nucleotide-binding domain-containing protein [Dyadobacter sp. CY261]|uniref:Crp/Fnr family transcriptional regulator n=1 Tax=Dyadobacter sp. CY261 TaxID=2907203 RepID=UPI001F341D42|nr:cyclic nucleotide-binding domain-containing protein [Dyadobacter sp. CY261]MCF0072987.1 cyclic nucleotide-binding domain-containing protein [Dyadobacter sp. CY261]